MREVLRTNDVIELSWAKAVLEGAELPFVVFDANIAAIEGSISAFECRLMVPDEVWSEAMTLLTVERTALQVSNEP